MIKCLYCGKETKNSKFCSKKCTTTWHHRNEPEKFMLWTKNNPEKLIERNKKIMLLQKGVPEKDWVKKQTSRIMKEYYSIHPSNMKKSVIEKRWSDPEQRKMAKERMEKRWANKEIALVEGLKKGQIAAKGRVASDIQRRRLSEIGKVLWENPDHAKKCLHIMSPNRAEKFLDNLLQEILPNSWKYVGDGEMVIGGKCPDFVSATGKKIIELYGDYWHKGDDPQDRIDYFKNFGYDALVVWWSEFKNIDKVKGKLFAFANKEVI